MNGVIPAKHVQSKIAVTDAGSQGSDGLFVSLSQTSLYNFPGSSQTNGEVRRGLDEYDIATNEWLFRPLAGNFSLGTTEGSMHASGGGLGFMARGGSFQSLIEFDAKNCTQLAWTQGTGKDFPKPLPASMQYVRIGEAGVLIGIGGNEVSFLSAQRVGPQVNYTCC